MITINCSIAWNTLDTIKNGGAFQTINHALITSWLYYYNMLCMGQPLKTTGGRSTMQGMMGIPQHAIPLLCNLHWLQVYFWVQFKVLVTTYKALHGIGSSYLRNCRLVHSGLMVHWWHCLANCQGLEAHFLCSSAYSLEWNSPQGFNGSHPARIFKGLKDLALGGDTSLFLFPFQLFSL